MMNMDEPSFLVCGVCNGRLFWKFPGVNSWLICLHVCGAKLGRVRTRDSMFLPYTGGRWNGGMESAGMEENNHGKMHYQIRYLLLFNPYDPYQFALLIATSLHSVTRFEMIKNTIPDTHCMRCVPLFTYILPSKLKLTIHVGNYSIHWVFKRISCLVSLPLCLSPRPRGPELPEMEKRPKEMRRRRSNGSMGRDVGDGNLSKRNT